MWNAVGQEKIPFDGKTFEIEDTITVMVFGLLLKWKNLWAEWE
jgi:hypothetical protein